LAGIFFGQRRTLAGGLVACVVAAGVPALLGTSVDPTSVDFIGSTAWLVNEARGELVRINAANGNVDGKVGDLGAEVGAAVSQEHNTVLVVVGGQIRSVDLANLNWGATSSVAPEGSLIVGDELAWLVNPDGLVRELDPTTLKSRGTVNLHGTPGEAVVSDDNLVVPLDDGTVRIVEGHKQIGKVQVGRHSDQLHVTRLGKRVVALNQTVGRLFRVDAEHGRVAGKADVQLPAGEIAVPTELPDGPLWVLARRSGDLVKVSTRTGEATSLPAVVTPRGDVLGPASAGGTVYLVDRSARQVWLYDLATGSQRNEPFPESVTDPSRVELVVEGGFVFVNDPAGSSVVVFDRGQARPVDKYATDGVPGTDPPPEAPPNQAAPTPGGGDPAPAPPATDPPAAPTRVTAVPGNGSASVSWNHGAGTTPPTTYHVTYEGRRTPLELPGDTSSVQIDGLRNGQNYVFEVWASNDYGESDTVRSNEVEPSDEVPGSPTNVTATPGNANADVSWEAADGRGNDIASYVVTAQPGGRTATVDARSTTARVDGLANDTAYTFTVVAVNDLGIQGQPSSPSAAVTPYGPPSQLTGLAQTSGDRNVTLTWGASTSRTPVTYTVAVTPAIGGQTQWTTTALTWSRNGLANGVQYTFTVTPQNDHGNGVAQRINVTPGYAASVSNVAANRTGDRQFNVTFAYDDGGLMLSRCEVQAAGGTHAATCNGGSGSVTIDVPNYFSDYTFTAAVQNSRGSGSAAATGTSAAKPYTVRTDGAAFDGACTWNSGAGGRPNTRPYYGVPAHTCPMWDPVNERPIGYLPLGTDVRGECHTTGDDIFDDNLVHTTDWIRISGYGWMPTIYFTNYQSSPLAGLPAC
jgi:hypothetical protein